MDIQDRLPPEKLVLRQMQVQQIKPVIAEVKFRARINRRHAKHPARNGLLRVGVNTRLIGFALGGLPNRVAIKSARHTTSAEQINICDIPGFRPVFPQDKLYKSLGLALVGGILAGPQGPRISQGIMRMIA